MIGKVPINAKAIEKTTIRGIMTINPAISLKSNFAFVFIVLVIVTPKIFQYLSRESRARPPLGQLPGNKDSRHYQQTLP